MVAGSASHSSAAKAGRRHVAEKPSATWSPLRSGSSCAHVSGERRSDRRSHEQLRAAALAAVTFANLHEQLPEELRLPLLFCSSACAGGKRIRTFILLRPPCLFHRHKIILPLPR